MNRIPWMQAVLSKQQEYVLNLYNQLGPSNRLRAEAYLEGLVDGSYRKKRKKKEKIKFQTLKSDW